MTAMCYHRGKFDGSYRAMRRTCISGLSIAISLGTFHIARAADQGKVCQVAKPAVTFSVPYRRTAPPLSADPKSAIWDGSASTSIEKDCTHESSYPDLKTDVRGFWTDTDLYLLFRCPYKELNLFLPATGGPRVKIWDRDVVEMFLGDDWRNIRHYREFEIAPTGDWIDLAIDLDKKSYDSKWRSGWQPAARIDRDAHVWYAAARIPLKSVSDQPVKPGTKWRANLYRIDGLGDDSVRHFMCWSPTCVINRDPNHVPENFGTLVFEK